MSNTSTETRSDLRSEFDTACPRCGHADTLSIEIVCTVTLSIDGTEPCGNHYWDDATSCHCDECDHHGTVGEFRTAPGKAVQS